MLSKSFHRNVCGCDTFVALSDVCKDRLIIFGKNSDRPAEEVQEVVAVPASTYAESSKLKCTYIEIDQVKSTNAVILSKPAWMWGAEMGANEYGVVIGNEAVWTKLNGPDDDKKMLLGMDLLRLGLERSRSAEEAVNVIGKLLETYGQGGPCSEDDPDFTYHNSFLITDRKEAWVLETAGKLWAAERITSGFRNISNCLTIGTKIDLKSPNLDENLKSGGFLSAAELNFSSALSRSGSCESDARFCSGKKLLEKLTAENNFSALNMMEILRDEQSGICMKLGGSFVSTGSQVSILTPLDSKVPCVHFFTGTPDPSVSCFKPYVFPGGGSPHLVSPKPSDASDSSKVDRRHLLYKLQEVALGGAHPEGRSSAEVKTALRELESECVQEMHAAIHGTLSGKRKVAFEDPESLFVDSCMSEVTIYKH